MMAVYTVEQPHGVRHPRTQSHGTDGHSKSDGCEYRPDAEEAEWALRDPIKLLRKKLLDAVPQQEIDSIEQAVSNEIDEAVAFALDSPQPSTDDLEGSIWAN